MAARPGRVTEEMLMKRQLMPGILAALLVAPAVASAQMTAGLGAADPHAGHMMEMQQPAAAAPQAAPANDKLPPDAAGAPAALKASSRHQEWVDVALPGSATKIKTFIVYPERRDKAPVVLVIHEIFGLTDWVRGVADQLANEGFIAVAPDLLSGMGPNGTGSQELGEQQSTQVIRNLTPQEAVARLNAVRAYAVKLPSANGKSASIGFCWGGTASFNYAVSQPQLDAAVVYYGTSPSDPSAYQSLKAPVLGLYGGNDNRVTSTVPTAETEMKKLGKTYEPHIFEGAGHGFLRQQTGANGANMKATEAAWPLTVAFLTKYTK
jgi:carboxymethylenebutenolidase